MKLYSFGLAIAAALLALVPDVAEAINTGKAKGLASAATGGGNATPVYPKTIAELKSYLSSSSPQVIILNKTFDFRGSEGKKTETGCRPPNNAQCIAKNNGYKGQDCILTGTFATTGGCNNGSPVTITYDVAGTTKMTVTANKTIRGVGTSGVIIGKGLWLNGNNIIVQNIHITNLNPHVIWGGDGIYMQGLSSGAAMENIWIDHVKISQVGRQMLVANKAGVKSLTISNSELDGRTPYSASCDGRHYWTMLMHGTNTRVSLLNNYVHHTSGRAPKIGETAVFHAANNFFANSSGHNFNPTETSSTIVEGNYFEGCSQTVMLTDTTSALHAETSTGASCSAALGRACAANTVVSSSKGVVSQQGSTAISKVAAVAKLYTPSKAAKLSTTSSNFGVGVLAAI